VIASRPSPSKPSAAREIALALGGGGALGAFQAGVYEAFQESAIDTDRVAGSSIGAVNAALIAGNPEARRLERLRGFWDMAVGAPPQGESRSGDLRRVTKNRLGTCMLGCSATQGPARLSSAPSTFARCQPLPPEAAGSAGRTGASLRSGLLSR
jgi:NTE family protein